MNILTPLRYMRPAPGTSASEFFQNKGQLAQSVVRNSLNYGLSTGLLQAAQSAKAAAKSSSNSYHNSTSSYSSSVPSPVVPSPAVSPSQPQTFDYLDAPWASAYRMSKETAYSEALHNTSYQRAVKDMQRAGLNPAVIFGAGNGSTAGVPGFASSYAPPAFSPRASSGHGSVSGRSKSSDKLFSSSAYSVMSALGGIVGALATKSAGGYWIGTSLTQGAMSALSLLSKSSKR